MNVKVSSAILSLVPNALFSIENNDYATIVWNDNRIMPTLSEISEEQERIALEFENTLYQSQRAAEYPPITDYLDGVVKGDQAQIDAYIAACLAVKGKYPKV